MVFFLQLKIQFTHFYWADSQSDKLDILPEFHFVSEQFQKQKDPDSKIPKDSRNYCTYIILYMPINLAHRVNCILPTVHTHAERDVVLYSEIDIVRVCYLIPNKSTQT